MLRFAHFGGGLALLIAASAHAQAPACSAAKLAEISAAPTAAQPTVEIDCSATLPPNTVVRKSLRFSGPAASGVTFDCQGGRIEPATDSSQPDSVLIQSQWRQGQWQRPQNITLRRCTIQGSLRIQGMAANGEGAALRDSSLRNGHTERAQAAAPANIMLDTLTLLGQGRIPLYLAPGVTGVTLQNSHVGGRSNSVAVYLDAESANNTLQHNLIDSRSARELVAIDGSAHNTIRHNRFSALSHGGLFLYRNCGEGGTVRHQTPSHNTISDNTFFYRHYHGRLPAVWLGARNGNRNYCQADAGYPFGSSISNLDGAQHNRVNNNRIYKLSPLRMIRDHGSDNMISGNTTVR